MTIGTKRVCGGWRGAHTRVAPALFMTPRAVLRRPRLLMEVILLPLFTASDKSGPFTGPQPESQTNSGNSPLIRHVFMLASFARGLRSALVSSQQIGGERADSRRTSGSRGMPFGPLPDPRTSARKSSPPSETWSRPPRRTPPGTSPAERTDLCTAASKRRSPMAY